MSILFYCQSGLSQCLDFFDDPQLLNIPPCGGVETTPVPFSNAHAFLLPALTPGSTYDINLCISGYPLPPNQMELVVIDPSGVPISDTFHCAIQFQATIPGDYLVIFNEVGNCGGPSENFGVGVTVFQECGCFYDRLPMVEFVLDPLSGIDFLPAHATLYSPFIDFGFGPGFEGMIPQGTVISPAIPVLDTGFVAPFDAYFFYIDEAPYARFEHPTRFILIDPTDCNPSLSNGSIIILEHSWWPILELPGQQPFEPFLHEPITLFPPAPDNLDGLIDGIWWSPGDIVIPEPPHGVASPKKAAAIVVAGDNRSDMRADIPRWKAHLQDSIGLDSARILCSANDSAVTAQQFCDLLDTLCALECKPDTIFIRISTHGGVGFLEFANRTTLTARQLCQKMKKIAKLGVPIMLLIDACNSSSLYDANNWGFPAGSMIIVGAVSGRYALGGTVFEADANGNPIPGTRFTGGLLSSSLIKCQNDTTDANNDDKPDADTNKDGEVDDCEAFNWVDTQRPCFVQQLGANSFQRGSYMITLFRMYPAGPPPGFVADTFIVIDGETFAVQGNSLIELDPMPSYRPVGNFGKSMNWNVQNMTGEDRNAFYMTFCGDVSNGLGSAWRSTATDSLTGQWSEIFGATATYDAATDETTICWMTSNGDAANGDYIHFGYTNPDGKLRPKRQMWANVAEEFAGSGLLVLDVNSVPTTVSSLHLNASGSPVTIKTANLNAFQGGTGHPVNYTIGYRVSPTDVPLENLTLADSVVSSLPYVFVATGLLDTNDFHQFQIQVPNDIKVGESLILQVGLDWSLNGNTNEQLIIWPSLNPQICDGDLVYENSEIIPNQINSDGKILLNDVTFQNGITTLNAKNGIEVTPGSNISIPLNATVYVYDYGCEEENILLPFQQQQLLIGPDNEFMLKKVNQPKK